MPQQAFFPIYRSFSRLDRRAVVLIAGCLLGLLQTAASGQDWLALPIESGIVNPSAKVVQAQKLIQSQRFELAVQLLREAVDAERDPDAQYLLGWCYANGKGVSRSLLQAEESFFGAAQRKHAAALYTLGRLRLDTAQPGNTKRVMSGIDSLEQAAELGTLAAMRRLGILYREGLPGSLQADLKVALEWFNKAGGAGDAESIFYQAAILDSADSVNNSAQAMTLYHQAAAGGSISAMLHLGGLAIDATPPDRTTAIGWYEQAAALESAEAHYRLGLVLRDSDPAAAFTRFRSAANSGHAAAQAELGVAYEEGFGTTKNIADAVAAYQKSAKRENPLGQFRLGVCYEYGFGVGKNQMLATENFQLSGQAGHAEAQHRMGRRYMTGETSVKDLIAAAAWFQLGAAQDHAPCQRDLGEIYETATGPLQNPGKALDLYRRAAVQGDAESWFRLGRMVEQGIATTVNLEDAYHLYLGATEKGYATAKSAAASVARRLPPSVVKSIQTRYRTAPQQVPGQPE